MCVELGLDGVGLLIQLLLLFRQLVHETLVLGELFFKFEAVLLCLLGLHALLIIQLLLLLDLGFELLQLCCVLFSHRRLLKFELVR